MMLENQRECPIWYSQLTEKHKNVVKKIIGNAKRSSVDLENKLMDDTGTDRRDAQYLLRWWFRRVIIFLSQMSCS